MYSIVVIWCLYEGQSMVGTLNQHLILNIKTPLMGLTKKSLHKL